MEKEPHIIPTPGGLERPEDERDYSLGGSSAPVEIPEAYHNDIGWAVRVLYQGKRPACRAHAAATLKMILDEKESAGRYYTPRFNWIDIKTFDGHPLLVGTDMRSIFKSLGSAGALDFDKLGNDVTLNDVAYADRSAVTEEMRELANPRIIDKGYGFINRPSFYKIKEAIYKYSAVIILMDIGQEFYTNKNGKTSWKESDILPLRVPTKDISGHFVVAHSYDKDHIYFVNSFSEKWGKVGHGYFKENYVPYVREMGTAADISDLVIPNLKKKLKLAEQLLGLWKIVKKYLGR